VIGEAKMKPTGKRPALKTTAVGGRVLVYYDSVLRAIGIDPATEPADTRTITIKRTQALTGLSARTVDRMIADGREAEPAQAA
jgi:hypothetical protein